MNTRTIIFDLDGTLTDPKVGITRCIQYALENMQLAVPDTTDLLWCIGPPLQESFAQLAGSDRVDEAIKLYRRRFSTIGLFENTPYSGIHDALDAISHVSHQLMVASSKPKVFVDKILERFGLTQYFTHVYGAELDGTRSDKTALLQFALSASQITAKNAIMIGDRKHDIIGAKNNGLASIGVLYGYGSSDELLHAGAQELAESPAHLVQLLS